MTGSIAAFAGNAAIGELHDATGGFAVPMFLMAGMLTLGAGLALAFSEAGVFQSSHMS